MNTQEIIRTVSDLLIMTTVLTLAVDVAKWAFTGSLSSNSENIAVRMIDSVVDLPVKIIYAIFNLVLKVVEAVVKMLVSLISSSAARNIDFGSIKP